MRRKTGGARAKLPSQRGIHRGSSGLAGFDPNDVRYIAMHEAGHAVSAVVLGVGLEGVDIHRRHLADGALSLGFTKTTPLNVRDVMGKGEEVAMPHVVQRLTGVVAEAAVNPLALDMGGGHQDFESARRIAAIATCRATDHGGEMTIDPEELRRNGERLRRLTDSAFAAARRLVHDHRDAIVRVAELLQQRKELTGAEVAAIVHGIGVHIS